MNKSTNSSNGLNVGISELKDSINNSSDKNRNFLIAFLSSMIYLLIAIGSTTDKDLLMPESLLALPFVHVDAALIPFYIIAPIFILLLHLNLLFNLLEHRRKINTLEKKYRASAIENSSKQTLHTFIFNTLSWQANDGIDYYLSRALIITSLVIAPFFLLIIIEVRFIDYQSLAISTWHLLCVIADLLILIIYWERINNTEWLDIKFRQPVTLFKAVIKSGSIIGWYNTKVLVSWLILISSCLAALAQGRFSENYSPEISDSFFQQTHTIIIGICICLWILLKKKEFYKKIEYITVTIWLCITSFLVFSATSDGQWNIFIYQLHQSIGKILILPTIALLVFIYCKTHNIKTNPLQSKSNSLTSWILVNGLTVATIAWLILYGTLRTPAPEFMADENTKEQKNSIFSIEYKTNQEIKHRQLSELTELHLFLFLISGKIYNGQICDTLNWICPRLKVKNEIIFSALDEASASAIHTLDPPQNDQGTLPRINNYSNLDVSPIQLPSSLIPEKLENRNLRLADFSGSKLYGINLTNINAHGSTWKNASLQKSEIKNANLNYTDFTNASLSFANLSRSKLLKSNLYQADLQGTNFYLSNLSGATLIEAKIEGMILAEARSKKIQLEGSNLSNLNLSHLVLEGANLYKTKLIDSYLKNINLNNSNLQNADLSGAYLAYAKLSKTDLRNAKLKNAKLQWATLTDSDLSNAILTGADINNVHLNNTILRGAQLSEASFNESIMVGADFSKATLDKASLKRVNLSGANLSGANLSGANLEDAKLIGAIIIGANLTDANLEGADLSGAKLTSSSLLGVNLTRTILKGTIIEDTKLSATTPNNLEKQFGNTNAIYYGQPNLKRRMSDKPDIEEENKLIPLTVIPQNNKLHLFYDFRRDLACNSKANKDAIAKGLLTQQTPSMNKNHTIVDSCMPRYWKNFCPSVYDEIIAEDSYRQYIEYLDKNCKENFSTKKKAQ